MLKRSTIDRVNDLSLTDVISKFITLKKKGANYEACSPFTDEKTPSFKVSPAKSIWKCFSTGKGGASGISFVEQYKNLTFIESVKAIADNHGIAIEYDEGDEAIKYLQKVEKTKSLFEMNAYALQHFIANYEKLDNETKRATPEMASKFSLGFALDSWDDLTNVLRKQGFSNDQMIDGGLAAKGEKKVYDFFRGRIMFPIFLENGKVSGFSGRDVTGNKKAGKVINTKETKIYSKSSSLLGLFQSKTDILKDRKATLVEGNYDMTSLQSQGVLDAVSPLGSAFTAEQGLILKKYADTVTLAVDNDKPGLATIEKNTITLLKSNINVMVFIPSEIGHDPDDEVKSKKWKQGEFLSFFDEKQVEAIDYLADFFFEKVKTTFEKTAAKDKLIKVLSLISDARIRNSYVSKYVKKYQIVKADVEKEVSVITASNDTKKDFDKDGYNFPSHIAKEELNDWKEYGFYIDQKPTSVGYYFPVNSATERISNFIVKPLFQISSGMNDSKRILELRNEKKTVIIEVSNKAFVSNQHFEEIAQNQGNFWFNGTKRHFQKLKVKILPQFPFCREIKTLGWQNSGFFSFADGIVENGNFKKVDSYGLAHFGDDKFFLPAFSKLYREIEEEDDFYESDRHFVFKESKINLNGWCSKMETVHLENGRWASLFLITSLFRDFIFSSESNFPHLFMFGQVQTGKSTCARSLSSVFFGNQSPFQLSSGTNVGFHRKIARTKNTVVWFDEYTNDIEEKRFQALKAAFDGAGHERGVMSRDNRTETTKINSALVISGQYIPTRDDNSLNTRSILLTFDRKAEDITTEQIANFQDLRDYELGGLSNLIVEIVKYRDLVEKEFTTVLFETISGLKHELQGNDYKGRIMNNYAIILSVHKILKEALNIPFDWQETFQFAIKKIMSQSEQVADSDALRSFWKMVDFLSSQLMIHESDDYVIKENTSIRVREGRETTREVVFDRPKRVLFLRFTKVHPLYMAENRKQFGAQGIAESSIKSYMKSAKSFLGIVKSVSFNGVKTSGYAFDYDMLNLTLRTTEKTVKAQAPKKITPDSEQGNLPY